MFQNLLVEFIPIWCSLWRLNNMDPRNLNNDLKTTERNLKRLDIQEVETEIPDSEDYYQNLHDRIMASVVNVEIKPLPPLYKTKDLLKRHWRKGLYLITMSALATVVGVRTIRSIDTQFSGNHAVLKFQNEDQMIGLIKDSPSVLDNTALSLSANQDLMSNELYSNIDLTKELIDSM